MCPEDDVTTKIRHQTELIATSNVAVQPGAIEYEYVCPMKCHSSKEPGTLPCVRDETGKTGDS